MCQVVEESVWWVQEVTQVASELEALKASKLVVPSPPAVLPTPPAIPVPVSGAAQPLPVVQAPPPVRFCPSLGFPLPGAVNVQNQACRALVSIDSSACLPFSSSACRAEQLPCKLQGANENLQSRPCPLDQGRSGILKTAMHLEANGK